MDTSDGTYTLGMWGNTTFVVKSPDGLQSTSYKGTAIATHEDFLVGSATTIKPYTNMVASSCNKCHQDIYYHGAGRHGYDTCQLCHQTSGAQDNAEFVASPSTANSIEFRNMLHKIHLGDDLYDASTWGIIGGNGSKTSFTGGFPALPVGVKQCTTCHGTSTNYHDLTDRNHPTEQNLPVKAYSMACLSCHDDPSAQAHASLQVSSGGVESCTVCHGDGKDYDVTVMHKPR
ncbi:MAG: multiheme c-type cytochrome [Planctomycetota bacterium]